jgi:hypothetical protein
MFEKLIVAEKVEFFFLPEKNETMTWYILHADVDYISL